MTTAAPGWSDDEKTQLKDAWQAGLSASQISQKVFNGLRTRSAVIGAAHRMGLSDGTRTTAPRKPKAPKEPRTRSAGGRTLPQPVTTLPARLVAAIEAPFVEHDTQGCQYFTGEGLTDADKCAARRVRVNGKDSPYCGSHHALCNSGTPNFQRRQARAVRRHSIMREYS